MNTRKLIFSDTDDFHCLSLKAHTPTEKPFNASLRDSLAVIYTSHHGDDEGFAPWFSPNAPICVCVLGSWRPAIWGVLQPGESMQASEMFLMDAQHNSFVTYKEIEWTLIPSLRSQNWWPVTLPGSLWPPT